MLNWWPALLRRLDQGPVVMITVLRTAGSTPREVGARMLVAAEGFDGTIGGGVLEYGALAQARALLARQSRGELGPWHREVRTVILGPDAGQCCGGRVVLLCEGFSGIERAALVAQEACDFISRPIASGVAAQIIAARVGGPAFKIERRATGEQLIEALIAPRRALHIYGAGHVGQALVSVLDGAAFDVHWIDVAAERFPTQLRAGVAAHVTSAPAEHGAMASPRGVHLVMTHSHAVDEAICTALLRRGDAAFVGLIGSATKRARFVQRFRRAGVPDVVIDTLVCPIGLDGIEGKAPVTIAIAVAAQLLSLRLDDVSVGPTAP